VHGDVFAATVVLVQLFMVRETAPHARRKPRRHEDDASLPEIAAIEARSTASGPIEAGFLEPMETRSIGEDDVDGDGAGMPAAADALADWAARG
jgi:hypothetical protein